MLLYVSTMPTKSNWNTHTCLAYSTHSVSALTVQTPFPGMLEWQWGKGSQQEQMGTEYHNYPRSWGVLYSLPKVLEYLQCFTLQTSCQIPIPVKQNVKQVWLMMLVDLIHIYIAMGFSNLSTYLPTLLPTYTAYLPIWLPVCTAYLPTYHVPALRTYLHNYLPPTLPITLSTYDAWLPSHHVPALPTYLHIYLPLTLPIYLSTYTAYLPTYDPTTYLPTCLPTCLPFYLPTHHILTLPTYLPNAKFFCELLLHEKLLFLETT